VSAPSKNLSLLFTYELSLASHAHRIVVRGSRQDKAGGTHLPGKLLTSLPVSPEVLLSPSVRDMSAGQEVGCTLLELLSSCAPVTTKWRGRAFSSCCAFSVAAQS